MRRRQVCAELSLKFAALLLCPVDGGLLTSQIFSLTSLMPTP
jgi:hypothetical protein